MKRFLRWKWHSIPVGIVAVLLALVLVAGGVLAYTVWTGTAEVGVTEALRVEYQGASASGSASVDWEEGIHTLSIDGLMPGEAAVAGFVVYNDSSVALPVTVTMTQTGGLGKTVFQDGTDADVANVAPPTPGPAPTYSWMTPGILFEPPVENPLTFDIPANGDKYVITPLQAGTSIVPGDYAFSITVER